MLVQPVCAHKAVCEWLHICSEMCGRDAVQYINSNYVLALMTVQWLAPALRQPGSVEPRTAAKSEPQLGLRQLHSTWPWYGSPKWLFSSTLLCYEK